MNVITFVVEGQPMSQPRARFARIGGHVRTYDPKEAIAYKDSVRAAFMVARATQNFERIAEGPIRVSIVARFERPKGKCSAKAPRPLEWLAGGKDVDNIAKIVLDALNSMAWTDDRQVASLEVRKHISPQGEAPYLFVSIQPA